MDDGQIEFEIGGKRITMRIIDNSYQMDEKFWPEIERIFRTGLTDEQVEAALDAGRAESAKWVGSHDWGAATAHIVLASLAAVFKGDDNGGA